MKILEYAAMGAVLVSGSIVGCTTTRYADSNAQAVDDATITANVRSALVQDPVTRSRNISVNTLHGTVELSGFVDSMAERREAARVSRNVPGVNSVEDQLQINGSAPVVSSAVDDQTITADVRSALAANAATATPQIKVATSNGVVQLAGFVDTNEERATAASIASSIQGVRSVDNDLRLNRVQ